MTMHSNRAARRGQALVEYALIIAGVVLACAVGVSLFGHKTGGLIDAVAVVLPGAHLDDNGPIAQGELIETTGASAGPIALDLSTIKNNSGTDRLDVNLTGQNQNMFGGLVVDPSSSSGS